MFPLESDTPRRNTIQFLDAAREQYEKDFQYDPRCPYNSAEEFVDKVKEVLNSGYDYKTESVLLERIPYEPSIDVILGIENLKDAGSGISFITQEAIRRMQSLWDKSREDFSSTHLQMGFSMWMERIQDARLKTGKNRIGNKTEEQYRKSFMKKLRKAVKYMHSKNYLPDSILDLTKRVDAMWYSSTKQFSALLYAVMDYGFSELIASPDEISDKCWMEALELTICRHADGLEPLDFIRLDDEPLAEVLDAVWPQVIIYGLLIHSIRHLGNDKTYVAINNIYYEIDPAAEQIRELEQQAKHDAAAIAEGIKIIEKLEAKARNLQDKLNKTPDYSRQISALNHEHNLAMKGKDEQIKSLLTRIERMETERMELEQQIFQQDEAVNADKPWLNMELPRENIIFLGGHPNMLKKLKEVYPEWDYIGTETEAVHNLPNTCDYIFIWSGHISHGTWYHIDNRFLGREKFLFVQATNIQRLEEEMKYELWKRRELDARRDS